MHESDVLVAPSLGGESFGMVLTEAFASGTPVVASDIAGYRDVVTHGVDGLLVRAGDPAAVGEALHALATDPARRERMGAAARRSAERFAWPHVAAEVMEAYEDAIEPAAAPASPSRAASACAARGPEARRRAAAGRPAEARVDRARSARVATSPRRPAVRVARKAAVVGGALGGVGLSYLALQRIGTEQIVDSLVAATPVWVLVALALMCLSMLVRAEAWTAILRAAIPEAPVRRRDAARGVMIGVLMSATLPARLGEPSRALIVARRLGRVRERLPVVLGTLISQTLLNLLALAVLGTIMFATVGLFQGKEKALVFATIAPVVVIALLLSVPALLRRGKPSRFKRLQQALTAVRGAMVQARRGLVVFRNPKLGSWAVVTQLFAWALQWIACYALLVALGLDHLAGHGRRGRRAVRGQRHRRAAGHAVEHRRLPGGLRGGAVRLRRQPHRRPGLRDHPAGGRDRDRAGDGHAGARARGHDVEGPEAARDAHLAGRAGRRRPQARRRPRESEA